VQAKGINNIFDKMIPEIIPNLKKELSRYKRLFGQQTG
jgi:hypothetical protein